MMIRNLGLMAILLLTLSFVPAQNSSSDDASRMMNDTVTTVNAANVVKATENNTTTEVGMPTASVSMQGIWKATLGKKEIIMAVNQSAQSLYGLAKFEGDNPWNGALAGSLSANAVSFSLAALEGGAQAAIYISASLEGDSMSGFFIRSDSNGKASRGDFTATLISPDTSGYIPAVVTAAPLPAVQMKPASTEQKNEINASEEVEKPASVKSESRFKDVTTLAKGINPDILPRMAPL